MSRGPCCIARLIRMPLSLTMITELQITAWTFASKSWTRSASRRNYCVATVRCWTPTRIWIRQQHTTHHKVFIFRYHIGMCFEQKLNVRWMHWFSTLRTGDIRPRLSYLNCQITLQTDSASGVSTCEHCVHVVSLIIFHIAQLTFLCTLSWLLGANRWCFVPTLWRCRFFHENKGNAIYMARSRAWTLRWSVIVVELKSDKR